jgi:catechol 2,3-dioxygenase-like lactoylglutathione lyase family enzyme
MRDATAGRAAIDEYIMGMRPAHCEAFDRQAARRRPRMKQWKVAMPRLDRVLETVLYVDDFDRACPFYEQILGLACIYSDQRLRAYDVGGNGVLLLFRRGQSLHTIKLPGGTIPPHDGHGPAHVAFSIPADELPAWEQRLRGAGVEIEGRTKWPRGGHSIYFRDPDGHLMELATPGLWAGY